MQLTPPVLQLVPRSERLTYKVSVDGALLLKQGRFMKRYTGNKHVEIDINGKVWLNPKGLKDAIASAKKEPPRKKEARVETQAVKKVFPIQEQISGNLSTQQSGLPTIVNDFSPKPAKKFSVNKKEVPRRIMAMLNSQMGYRELYFMTVSFPPCITDALGMQLLNTWLTSLRKYRMIRQYIWVAERQKIGTIHFHICIPHFINVHRANRMMAGSLKELHRKGVINYFGYAKYNGVDLAGTRPNGKGSKKQITNFAGKQKAKALGWYLTKYITKNATEFDQLAWHNSRGYTALHHGITLTDEEFIHTLGYVEHLNEGKIFEREWFAWAPWARGTPDAIQLELFKVNSYTQYLNGYFHSKDEGVISYAGELQRHQQTCYHNVLTNHNSNMDRFNTDLNKMSLDKARELIVENERRMRRAFIAFCNDESFTKEFCDEVYFKILQRVDAVGMQREFIPLRALLAVQSEEEFCYLYYLYCYWAVDLLNQIPNN